jgi:hypothetical protein
MAAVVVAVGAAGGTSVTVRAAEVRVATAAEFRAAVAAAVPGVRILLEPGEYGAGFHFRDLRGEPGRPIVLAAADPARPPVFSGGNTGLQLSNPAHVELDGLAFRRHATNGVNVDDVGSPDATRDTAPTTHGVVLRRLQIADIGSEGNHDGIKLSGLYDFRVEGCTIERWGTKGGSAIDLVGCHRGEISGNTLRHVEPAPGNCTGVQAKGGTSEIAVRGNRFEHAGGRAVNIGGSTGRQFFRPRLDGPGPHAEARAIVVEGNTFVGGVTPVAFVGVDGAVVRRNTIERPGRWALRILQENRAADFVACRNGEFSENTIVFGSTQWAEGGVNIGAGTAPDTFRFARNWWYCVDRPERSAPRLPTPEQEAVHGRDPRGAGPAAGAGAGRGP